MAEDAGAGQATGEDTDEVDGVDLDALAVDALAELAAGGALEHELERLAVDRGPLGDDVGDEATVVLGGERASSRPVAAQSRCGGPHVAGEADVEQVLERRPADRRPERDREVAHRRRRAPAALDRLRPDGRSCATTSSLVRCARSRICSSFMPSTQWCESISLLSGTPLRSWCTNSGNDACASPEPSTCSAILRTSHRVQSVGSVHSSGDSEPTSVGEAHGTPLRRARVASGRVIRFGDHRRSSPSLWRRRGTCR